MPQDTVSGEEWRAMDVAPGTAGAHAAYDPSTDAEQAALERARTGIERYRKRDIVIQVLKRDGSPATGLPIDVVQTRHSFPFGDQLWALDRMHRMGEHETDRGVYWRLRFKQLLNAATALCYWTERPQNDGPKTEDIQGRNVTEHFAYCVDWAASQGLTVKGHPLFWSIDKCVPEWVKRYDYETQMKFAEVRVRSLVARFRGRVTIWDAVNEAIWEPTFRNLPNRDWPTIEPIPEIADYVAQVLCWVRDEDPDATYLINDYGTEKDPDVGAAGSIVGRPVSAATQRRRYIALAEELKARGTPPDAIGLQSHTGGWMTHAEQMAVYDEYAATGLPVHVTEFWASTRHLKDRLPDEQLLQLQADYVANVLTCAFGHPNVQGFFFWGMMGAAVRWRHVSSHELMPVYHRITYLLQEAWRTRASLVTDEAGRIALRAFYGDYVLRYRIQAADATAPGGAVAGNSVNHGVRMTVDSHASMPLTVIAPFA